MTPQTRASMLDRLHRELHEPGPHTPRRRKLKLTYYALAYGASLTTVNRTLKRERGLRTPIER